MSNLSLTASSVVMIKPISFCANPDTIESNSFQIIDQTSSEAEIINKAQFEFENFQKKLINAGINVLNFNESNTFHTPDALFPNNWFCHMPDETVYIFPMYPANRRLEFREDIIKTLNAKKIIDLRYLEKENVFLEGTGSLILDHDYKIGYACLSSRTSQKALDIFSESSGYKIISFDAFDENQSPLYHTNVMMALSPQHAIINLSSIVDEHSKNTVIDHLKKSNKIIIDIGNSEMKSFAGNMLFLKNSENKYFWICSEKAYNSLSLEQKNQLGTEGRFIFSALNTIESVGGGGARCLLAEVFSKPLTD